jgi:predicted transcriptional regulator
MSAMSTPIVKLPPALWSRVAALAKKTGRSPQSFIVEAVERHTAVGERVQEFIAQALAADRAIERTGEAYAAEDVHTWLDQLARGEVARRPKPRHRSTHSAS